MSNVGLYDPIQCQARTIDKGCVKNSLYFLLNETETLLLVGMSLHMHLHGQISVLPGAPGGNRAG